MAGIARHDVQILARRVGDGTTLLEDTERVLVDPFLDDFTVLNPHERVGAQRDSPAGRGNSLVFALMRTSRDSAHRYLVVVADDVVNVVMQIGEGSASHREELAIALNAGSLAVIRHVADHAQSDHGVECIEAESLPGVEVASSHQWITVQARACSDVMRPLLFDRDFEVSQLPIHCQSGNQHYWAGKFDAGWV